MGVKGGGSLLDRDVTVQERYLNYVANHPGASFEELEAACFPQLDGSLHLRAISPRHLEACATRTCQILLEGDYNGILKPGWHYIELKRDFSNVDEVLDMVHQDHLREAITERAYREIVESGQFTYRRFVEYVMQCTLGNLRPRPYSAWVRARIRAIGCWNSFMEGIAWIEAAILTLLIRFLPKKFLKVLRNGLLKIG